MKNFQKKSRSSRRGSRVSNLKSSVYFLTFFTNSSTSGTPP